MFVIMNYWWPASSSLPHMVTLSYMEAKKIFFNEEHQPIFLLVIYIFIFISFLKRKALKSTLNRDNSCDSSQKIYADLDWQLYIWGRYDLVLMLSLATLLMRPRSVLAGRWAAGRHGQSWKVGKWLRLHNCDWLQPRGTTFSDFTHPGGAAELWSRNERAKVRQRWSRECERTMGANYNEAEWCGERRTWMAGGKKEKKKRRGECKSDWCVEIEEGKMWVQEKGRRPGSHVFIFQLHSDLLLRTQPLFLAWRTFTAMQWQCDFYFKSCLW